MSLIIQSPTVMTNPGDAPLVPNIAADMWQDFNMADWTGPLMTEITSLVANGPADINERTWSLVRGTGNMRPNVYDNNGIKYLHFSGDRSLANNAGTTYSVESPLSFCMLTRVRTWSRPDLNWGLLRGTGGHNIGVRLHNTQGNMAFVYGGDTAVWTSEVQTGLSANQWFVLSVAYDAEASSMRVRAGGAEFSFDITGGVPSMAGRGFGRNTNATTGAAHFDLSRYREYTRALRFEDMRMLERRWLLDAGLIA